MRPTLRPVPLRVPTDIPACATERAWFLSPRGRMAGAQHTGRIPGDYLQPDERPVGFGNQLHRSITRHVSAVHQRLVVAAGEAWFRPITSCISPARRNRLRRGLLAALTMRTFDGTTFGTATLLPGQAGVAKNFSRTQPVWIPPRSPSFFLSAGMLRAMVCSWAWINSGLSAPSRM